jgi:RNA polymerase sigma-70 factor (ECF subfamily)
VPSLRPDIDETARLLRQVRSGDRQALGELLAGHREELRHGIELRMDRAMRSRVDPSDIVQEAQAEVLRRIGDYLQREPMPFHLWLRQLGYDYLLRIRRRHVEADCRTVHREMALPEASSVVLARDLLGSGGTPSQHVEKNELLARLNQAMADLADEDREVLLLRNYEGLSSQEVGQLLGIEAATVRKRHGRALIRLREALLARGVTGSQA